jgi:pentapeptide repeat protein
MMFIAAKSYACPPIEVINSQYMRGVFGGEDRIWTVYNLKNKHLYGDNFFMRVVAPGKLICYYGTISPARHKLSYHHGLRVEVDVSDLLDNLWYGYFHKMLEIEDLFNCHDDATKFDLISNLYLSSEFYWSNYVFTLSFLNGRRYRSTDDMRPYYSEGLFWGDLKEKIITSTVEKILENVDKRGNVFLEKGRHNDHAFLCDRLPVIGYGLKFTENIIDLRGKHFQKSYLPYADFSTLVVDANFNFSYLMRTNFAGSHLLNTGFSFCNLRHANFTNVVYDLSAMPSYAKYFGFINADLSYADFTGAKITGISFKNATVWNTNFANVEFANCIFNSTAYWNTANFAEASFKDCVFFNLE